MLAANTGNISVTLIIYMADKMVRYKILLKNSVYLVYKLVVCKQYSYYVLFAINILHIMLIKKRQTNANSE